MRVMEPGDLGHPPGGGEYCPVGRAARPLRALIVEDSDDDYELLVRCLRRGGFDVTPERVQTPGAMRKALGAAWDIVFADWTLPSFSALEALVAVMATGRTVPFLIVSGTVSDEMADGALQAGASAFILKGAGDALLDAVRQALGPA
jgi:CheY-like chemotaxis protein